MLLKNTLEFNYRERSKTQGLGSISESAIFLDWINGLLEKADYVAHSPQETADLPACVQRKVSYTFPGTVYK